ncbi:MAG: hypothetical protein HZB38_07750, partial [Planctomycetes bacterium]|nr:hypothetical protein [Planctomycetota bacterium]
MRTARQPGGGGGQPDAALPGQVGPIRPRFNPALLVVPLHPNSAPPAIILFARRPPVREFDAPCLIKRNQVRPGQPFDALEVTNMSWKPRAWATGLAAALGLASAAHAQTGFVHWETPHVNPITLTPSGNLLLAVNTADNRLEVFRFAPGGAPIWVRSIAVGLDPVSVRARTDNEIWVVNHISDSISIVDLPSGRIVRTIQTGDEPADVVFAGSPQRAFVSVSQLNQVRVFDPANLAAAPTILTIQGEDPRALAVDAAGSTVFVGIFESGNKTTSIPIPVVNQVTGPYGGQNPPPNSGNQFSPPIDPLLPPPPPVALILRQNAAGQWMDDNNRNWSAFVPWAMHDQDVAMINTSTLAITYARGLMTTVMNLAVRPDGVVTAIGAEATNEIRFEPNVNSTFVRCEMSSFNPAAPNVVNTVDLNPHLDYSVRTLPQATRDLSIGDPRAIVWSPSGDRAFIAGMGSNQIIVVDPSGVRLGEIGVGLGPTGLVRTPDGSRLYVLNKFDASITQIDVATSAVVSEVSFFDPTPAAIKSGRPFLYDTHLTSGLGQVSCASCHIDGRNDGLAWDLGNPAGEMKDVNFPCRQGPGNCRDWHPMKGPMVTQSLVGIVGVEPLHWRGDRENVAAFAGAFTGLQGDDAPPTLGEMQLFNDFLATIDYPPNPNRNLDDLLPTALPVTGGTGNAASGLTAFQTQPVLPGGLTCVACHALPLGTDRTIDSPNVGPVPPQSLKIAQLRGLNEKTGFSRGSTVNNRGFGYNHDSDRDTLAALLGPPFAFPPGALGAQMRRDVEAFMLSMTPDTHAAVGQQVTFDGQNNGNANLLTRYNTFLAQANANRVGLIARQRRGGVVRGF